ncbi:MAG TPA: signal peptidase I [Candidatus Sulfotelmatobacter sp.]|jgi:signal peptidase I|nr:signal peptidase I [Candidatus Sulfotelmatobacter sp.]
MGNSADPGSAGEMAIVTPSEGVAAPVPVPVPVAPPIRLSSGFGVWLRDLVISLAISAFIIIFLYQPVKVEGTSMMPSLVDQERIFVNKFVYRLEPIERGDIVVFRYPYDPSKSYIKRVIGMAGDRIRINSGQVYVNGEALDESYVPPEYTDSRSSPEAVVPANSYFVLGDHRSMSDDSRNFGPVNQSFIYGKAVFGYWPMDKLGRVR